ncbi:MAG TPA: GNAT family N-acetyltransferase [Candidatus Sulfomarinibacteraceae bacterium]|nr:GNAT family N-acetyltransferase [Candidatus Sulfomarinibacteraceae bacterium]
MSGSELVIRPFRPGDEGAVNDGFNAAFGLERSLDEWAWKFPPVDRGRLIMLAEVEGDLLAHYAGTPLRFTIDGREWSAAQIVDVYSTKAARRGFTRKGIWVQTVEAFFETFGRSGRASLLYGFPSPRPLRLGVLQLGYDAVEPQPIRYLSRPPQEARSSRRRHLYRAELAADWEPRLDDLWRRARRDYPVAAVRDAERALHRLAGHPTVHYHRFLVLPRLGRTPAAFVAFRTDQGRCRWVDLLWDHRHPGALELVNHLSTRLAAQCGAELEELWLNGDPAGQALLERRGFAPGEVPGQLVMVARAFDPELDVTALDGRVYLTMADADLV